MSARARKKKVGLRRDLAVEHEPRSSCVCAVKAKKAEVRAATLSRREASAAKRNEPVLVVALHTPCCQLPVQTVFGRFADWLVLSFSLLLVLLLSDSEHLRGAKRATTLYGHGACGFLRPRYTQNTIPRSGWRKKREKPTDYLQTLIIQISRLS